MENQNDLSSGRRAAFYMRVSTADQNPQTQLWDLERLAAQRGFQVVERYVDHGISGTRARRPALDRLLEDARAGKFDVIMVWAFDRMARSVTHLLSVLDELQRLNIAFISFRENIATDGALGRALTVIIGAIGELERNLIVERVRAGMRRARFEGRHVGRARLALDCTAIVQDRHRGFSLSQLAKAHGTSRTTIHRILAGVPKGCLQPCEKDRCS